MKTLLLASLIEFLPSLLQTITPLDTFVETSRCLLLQNLQELVWRVSSISSQISKQNKLLLDHSSSTVRQRLSISLPLSFSYEVTLLDEKSTRLLSCVFSSKIERNRKTHLAKRFYCTGELCHLAIEIHTRLFT